MGITLRTGAVTLALAGAAAIALPAGAQAAGIAPDRPAVTPIAHASAKAHKAVTAAKLSAGLAKLFRRVGRSGAFVMDASNNGGGNSKAVSCWTSDATSNFDLAVNQFNMDCVTTIILIYRIESIALSWRMLI